MSLQRDPSHIFKGSSDLKVSVKNITSFPISSITCDSPWNVYTPPSLGPGFETDVCFKSKKGQTVSGSISLSIAHHDKKIDILLGPQGPSVSDTPFTLGDDVFRFESEAGGVCLVHMGRRPKIQKLKNLRSEFLLNQRIEPITIVLEEEIPGVRFTVSPALPAGIYLDDKKGVISGVPRKISGARNFQVKVLNDFSGDSMSFNLRVEISAEETKRMVSMALEIFSKNYEISDFDEALKHAVHFIDAETADAPEVNSRIKMESIRLANSSRRAKHRGPTESSISALSIPGDFDAINAALTVELSPGELVNVELKDSTHHEAEIFLHRPVRLSSAVRTLVVCESMHLHARSEIRCMQIMGRVEILSGNSIFTQVRFDGSIRVVKGSTAIFRSCEFAGVLKIEAGARATVQDSVFDQGAGTSANSIDIEEEAQVDLVNNSVIIQ